MLACGKKLTFDEQIKNDVVSKYGKVHCDSIPVNSTITNVVVGEIVPIGETGLIDVTVEFDFEFNSTKTHYKDAMLYSKTGSQYTLEKIGDCEYSRE